MANFVFTPDLSRMGNLLQLCAPSSQKPGIAIIILGLLNGFPKSPIKVTRMYRNGNRKLGIPSLARLEEDWGQLEQVDIDYFYAPGNPNIRQWAYIELKFDAKTATTQCHGDPAHFQRFFDQCIDCLALTKTQAQIRGEQFTKARELLDPELFSHLEGTLRDGNFEACLSAAVVFVEDRLRQKVGSVGQGLSGVELVNAAAGHIVPPLAFANGADEKARLMLRGWVGYVRNVHGHQTTLEWTDEEAFQQLLGVNYMFWVINNSTLVSRAS